MKRKNKVLILLIAVFVIITTTGIIYSWTIQAKELREKDQQLATLRADYANIVALDFRLKQLEINVAVVDSLLFTGAFVLPKNLPQSAFFRFIETYSGDRELNTFTNTEYVNTGVEDGFHYYTYKVSGNGTFDDVYGLIYAIEHSKELKKIHSAEVSGMTNVELRGTRRYLVKFRLEARTYFFGSDEYASLTSQENNLTTGSLHDAFYPLVRNEIKRNTSNLPDVQKATLVSLVPQGAFITDSNGNMLLMKKGDLVYLGYLDDIDYENETVTFVLNKGGLVEYLNLEIGKKHKGKK